MGNRKSIQGEIVISSEEMEKVFYAILTKRKFTKENAALCANIFMQNSLDGVYSHGVNRFPRFVEYIDKGYVKANNEAAICQKIGGIEQWDGQLGPGPTNALKCTERAMELAVANGIGCVALSNTNHWMRGGTFGWKAAKAGFVFIGWTNTLANMPAWGASSNKLGNNPLVLAVPYKQEAIVLDMAMSQYSYGALEAAELKGEVLPVPGGFNKNNELSTNPAEILESGRILPAGFWKGAGLSLLLDILVTVLSGGSSTSEISKREAEYGVSQVFIAINVNQLNKQDAVQELIDKIIKDYKNADLGKGAIVYPGERVVKNRANNLKNGIPVHASVWEKIKGL